VSLKKSVRFRARSRTHLATLGDFVDQARESKNDLTATIHLSALRSVSDPLQSLLDRATSEERDVIAALPQGSGMLIALSGPARGARFLIDSDEVRIGRSSENEIFLDDVTVSRKHARLQRNNGEFTFSDLGSLNGTYLDGVISKAGTLVEGSELQIGKYRLHFFLGGKGRR